MNHDSEHHETAREWLLVEAGMAGNLVNDAHLAAVAIENAAELISYDSDFGRFAGLTWSRPAV